MIKLTVIADDFTGALDTGVQFVKFGARVKILATDTLRPQLLQEVADEVLVINTETRHLSPAQAYTITYTLVECLHAVGVPNIYIKTDSGLRGNIGMVLDAALDASKSLFLAFVPAFPDMERVTVDGIHYINGKTIDQSVFGIDPFEPVGSPYVQSLFKGVVNRTELFRLQQDYTIQTERPTIGIFDAASNRDMERIAASLHRQDMLKVVAGCAGFASMLPPLLGLTGSIAEPPEMPTKLIVVCGSLNPITRIQLENAETQGFIKLAIPPEQLLEESYFADGKGDRWLRQMREDADSSSIILDTGISQPQVMQRQIDMGGMAKEDARHRISRSLGQLAHRVVQLGFTDDYTLMIIGGDTLMGFVEQVNCPEISPLCEVAVGVVLFHIWIDDRPVWMLSKSGGFGDPQLLRELTQSAVIAAQSFGG